MLVTANKNLDQTIKGGGSHFIGDFLPKEELDKFLKKKSGETVSDYEKQKLDAGNKVQ
jgi:hypothetical protein